jgi:undecaprenyl diphosphate synthase
MGHKRVVEERIEELIDHAGRIGIPFITFWAFSTENWGREAEEVKGIMNLFRWAFAHKAKKMVEKGARLKVIGDMSRFDVDLQEGMKQWMEVSKNNTKITVTFALNYGGRDEIVRAINKAVRMVRAVREEDIEACLDTTGMPDPDLIIRTSGEQRLSGFMPWQAVYSELYFTDTLMPDFGKTELDKALEEYGRRERRRGK